MSNHLNISLTKAMEQRRSVYALSPESPVSQEQILSLVEHAVQYVPSAFHSQSQRVAVLFGEQHGKLWNEVTMNALKQVVPPEQFAPTQEKITSFANAFGTVLFFNHTPTTEAMMQQFALYKDNFPVWAEHANGMLQYAVWMLLEGAGLGASLQHYAPLIDEGVYDTFGIDRSWRLIAQMPFGLPTAQPEPKEFMPLTERMLVLK